MLFENAGFTINSRERVALFGRNGSGKSTLFKIIVGEEPVDEGEVHVPKHYRIGFLRQYLKFSCATILEEACEGLDESEYYKGEIILEGLGFAPSDLARAPADFSGGYQLRLELAKLMVSSPDLLLLDEPTNYLDIISVRWLTSYLKTWPGEIMLISHDRGFCDAVSTHSALVYRGGLKKVSGSSHKLFEQIAEEEDLHERTRVKQEKERARMEKFISRFRAQASKATLVQSKVKALERMGKMEELSDEATLDFMFSYAPFPGKVPLEVNNLSFGYHDDLIIKDLSLTLGKKDRIAVIGKNGRGKSTFLKLIVGELQPRSGAVQISANARIGYFGQTNIDRLNPSRRIVDEVQEANENLPVTRIRNICGVMMFEGDDSLKQIKVLSGGERSRVLLGKILAQQSNLLLLDEPTSHLDIESIEALVEALESFEGAVLLVTHSEELLKRLATRLVVFERSGPVVFEGDYDLFLKTKGWDEESDPEGEVSVATPSATASKQEARRDKAEKRQQQSAVLTPLKKKVQGLEHTIAVLEVEVQTLSKQIADASENGKAGDIAALSKNLSETQASLAKTLTEWEVAMEEMESLEK